MRGMKLVKIFIISSLILSGVSIFFYGSYLENFYYQNAPRQPDKLSGRVVKEYVHHGTKIYLTDEEKVKLSYTSLIGGIITMLGMALAHFWNIGQGVPQNTIEAFVPPVKKKWIFW